MDVSEILAEHAAKQYVELYIEGEPQLNGVARQAIVVEKDIPLEVDAGFLTVTDPNPIDEDSYK